LLRCCLVYDADFRGRIDGAKRQSMTSVGEVTAEEGRGRKCFLVRPAGNRTGNLSLMRRLWYYKTTASAPINMLMSMRGLCRFAFCLHSLASEVLG
jgi:hypothetical protein